MSDQTTTNIAPMPKRAHHGPLSNVTSLQDAFDHPQFLARIKQATPKHLSPDRMLAVFVQSVQKTPKLRDCSLMSLLGAFLSVATVGLEPNTALQHAHLIPFNKRVKQNGKWVDGPMQVQVIFGYQGLLELAYRSGMLRAVTANVVWPGDDFDFWYGSNGQLKHRPRGGEKNESITPEWAYMHASMKHEGEAYEVMPWADVLAIRDASQGYKAALIAKQYAKPGEKLPVGWTEAPWVKHLIPMARKTAFRAGSKWLPKSIELAAALALDELQDRKTANFAGVIEGSAEVLNGGLDALPDEMTDQLDAGLGGSAGEPSREQEPAQQTRQQQTRPAEQRKEPPRTEPPVVVQARTVPAFEAYVWDDVGEAVSELLTDPGVFAEVLLKLWEGSDSRAVLIENNAEGIEAAEAFPAAADLLASLRGPAGELSAATMALPMVLGPRGGPDIPGWIKRAVEAVGLLEAHQVATWVLNNEPTYRPFKSSLKLEISKALAERCAALGIPAVGQATPKDSSRASQGLLLEGPEPTDEGWAKAAGEELARMQTEAGVVHLAGVVRAKMDDLKVTNPPVWRRLDELFKSRLAQVKALGPVQQAGADGQQQAGDPGADPE